MTQRREITAIATDSIPANLRFLYFYDCGADTHPLGNRTGLVSGNTATSTLEFDTGGACGSGAATGTVTVIASDGIDLSVERPTTSFEVERSAPVAAIPSPQAGAAYTDDQTITLHGSAYDQEGRQLPGGSLTWTSPDGLFTGTKTGNTVVSPPAGPRPVERQVVHGGHDRHGRGRKIDIGARHDDDRRLHRHRPGRADRQGRDRLHGDEPERSDRRVHRHARQRRDPGDRRHPHGR